jgi:lipid-A-disaccharide synthase
VEVIDQFALGSRQLAVGSSQSETANEVGTDRQLPTANCQLIALLPGSRKQEILKKLPIMLRVAKHFPEYQFVVAKAPGVEDNFYADLLKPYGNVSSVANKTYELLAQAKAALVTSGTATLETALFGVPEVICYKGNAISYQIAKRLIKIKFIGLVNLIMDKEVVKELIQKELTPENLEFELDELLTNEKKQKQVQEDYKALKQLLSKGGHASANAAGIIYNFLKT